MRRFADTFYFMALLNRRDSAHAKARSQSQGPGRIVTTEYVLNELADAMASRQKRSSLVTLYRLLRSDRNVEIVPASTELFEQGIDLYAARPDKDWSLTDCISFVVMRDRQITDALTGDHHFEQAGFRVLLK
jgi:uncharacterized protein